MQLLSLKGEAIGSQPAHANPAADSGTTSNRTAAMNPPQPAETSRSRAEDTRRGTDHRRRRRPKGELLS